MISRATFAWLVLPAVVFVLIGGAVFTTFVTRYGENLEKKELLLLAATAASSFDVETVRMLRGNLSDIGTDVFVQVRARLIRIRQANPESRFVYLLAPKNNQVIFLADAEPSDSEDYSPPGEEYQEAPHNVYQTFTGKQPLIEGPYQDRWGEWVTGLAPIVYPRTGQVVAVLGIDIKAERWRAEVGHYRWFGILVSAQIASIIFLCLIGLRFQGRFHERIFRLNEELKRELEDRTRAEQGLRLAAAVIDNTAEGIAVTRADGTIRKVNQSFEQITGWKASEAIGQTMDILKSGEHDAEFYREMRETLASTGKWRGEIWNRRKTGELYPQATTINALKENNGHVGHYAMIFSDVTEQKQLENKLRDLSSLDGLTGLYNRRAFDETYLREWKRAVRESSPLSLLMLDIDYFKKYNDHYGHLEGDVCIQQIAKVSKACVRRAADFVARYGGEEFVIILPETDLTGALGVANRIREEILALAIPHTTSDVAETVTVSIGCATEVPQKDTISLKLISQADQALYQAKANGRNRIESL